MLRGAPSKCPREKKNPFVDGSLLLVGPRSVRWIDQMSEAAWSLVTQQPKGHVTRLSAILAVPQHREPQRKVQKTPEDICLLSPEPSGSKYISPTPGTPPAPPADLVPLSSTLSCSAAARPSTCPGLWLQDSQPSSSQGLEVPQKPRWPQGSPCMGSSTHLPPLAEEAGRAVHL